MTLIQSFHLQVFWYIEQNIVNFRFPSFAFSSFVRLRFRWICFWLSAGADRLYSLTRSFRSELRSCLFSLEIISFGFLCVFKVGWIFFCSLIPSLRWCEEQQTCSLAFQFDFIDLFSYSEIQVWCLRRTLIGCLTGHSLLIHKKNKPDTLNVAVNNLDGFSQNWPASNYVLRSKHCKALSLISVPHYLVASLVKSP